MSALDDLLAEIFAGQESALSPEFAGWLRASRRFKAFAAQYRSKIRAKLRNVRDEGGLQDVRAELETAVLLLRAEQFTLEYEQYAAAKQRGPDFSVTFKTHTRFNVEVRRLRSAELDDASAEARSGKLIAVLCAKVGQMPASSVNLLWLYADDALTEADLNGAALTLRQLAERKAEDFFTRRGFASAADFLKQYRQLSGIVWRQAAGAHGFWPNPLARHPAPPAIVALIQRL